MSIFLTGGTGFIGSHFLKLALEAGLDVRALRRPGSQPVIPIRENPTWISGDLESVTAESIQGCDTLVHLAAYGVSDPQHAPWGECFRWNVTASLALWQRAASAGVKRMIIAGSCFEYGSSAESYEFIPPDAPLYPTGPYHASKAAATMAALGFSVDQSIETLILRPFHIFGEGEAPNRFWASLRAAAAEGKDFPMTSGDQVRDFFHVQSAALKFLEAVQRTDLKRGIPVVENLGSGNPKSLLDFATSEWQRLGATGNLIPGANKHRDNEVMRYVPKLPEPSKD